LLEETAPVAEPVLPTEPLADGRQEYMIRPLAALATQPALRKGEELPVYVPSQYQRYYIDLRWSFADYKQTFSSKIRCDGEQIKRFQLVHRPNHPK
jgi:hypothetical protein